MVAGLRSNDMMKKCFEFYFEVQVAPWWLLLMDTSNDFFMLQSPGAGLEYYEFTVIGNEEMPTVKIRHPRRQSNKTSSYIQV
jgi:hypothetical protein